jgi:hypothetical protein
MDAEQKKSAGECPTRYRESGGRRLPHASTSRDIDASRFVPVHICDYCCALFVPMTDEVQP